MTFAGRDDEPADISSACDELDMAGVLGLLHTVPGDDGQIGADSMTGSISSLHRTR